MSKEKLRLFNTETDNLVSNLRGEVGEVITTWILMRYFLTKARELSTGDVAKDMSNEASAMLWLIVDKLEDELVGRLSELGEEKIGRLNFFFAVRKLGKLEHEASSFTKLVSKNKLREKRNYDISHKELPEKWEEHRHISIPYRSLLKAIVAALRLMKKIDRIALGPAAPFLWREARKRRYRMMNPPRAAYMMVPYLRLSGSDRCQIVIAEHEEGREVWSAMPTTVNGVQTHILACRTWGVLHLGDRLFALDHYPLQELSGMTFAEPSGSAGTPVDGPCTDK
jgi:hypothetical protein